MWYCSFLWTLLIANQTRAVIPRAVTVRVVFSYHHAQFGPTISIMPTKRNPTITEHPPERHLG